MPPQGSPSADHVGDTASANKFSATARPLPAGWTLRPVEACVGCGESCVPRDAEGLPRHPWCVDGVGGALLGDPIVEMLAGEFGATVVGEYPTPRDRSIPPEFGGGTWDDVPVHEREHGASRSTACLPVVAGGFDSVVGCAWHCCG
jgi:hypothetical protein